MDHSLLLQLLLQLLLLLLGHQLDLLLELHLLLQLQHLYLRRRQLGWDTSDGCM